MQLCNHKETIWDEILWTSVVFVKQKTKIQYDWHTSYVNFAYWTSKTIIANLLSFRVLIVLRFNLLQSIYIFLNLLPESGNYSVNYISNQLITFHDNNYLSVFIFSSEADTLSCNSTIFAFVSLCASLATFSCHFMSDNSFSMYASASFFTSCITYMY